jgi:hypothetical protein
MSLKEGRKVSGWKPQPEDQNGKNRLDEESRQMERAVAGHSVSRKGHTALLGLVLLFAFAWRR